MRGIKKSVEYICTARPRRAQLVIDKGLTMLVVTRACLARSADFGSGEFLYAGGHQGQVFLPQLGEHR